MLTNDQIKEFQKMYKDYFGEEINPKQAFVLGEKLIELIKIVGSPSLHFNKENFKEEK